MRTFQQTLARDLVLSNGRLVLIDSVKAVATKLRNRLLLFSGEWFLDTRLGVPWFVFFEKNPDLDSLRRLVLSVITETSELITEVPQLDLDLDRATRTLRITFQVVCDGSLIEGDTAGEFFVDGAPVYVDPVPVLTSVTSVSQLGGTVTATGSAFLPGAVLWTDGVARVTTYVNATTLTAVVPAHAVGSVNAYVVQSSGTSGTVTFAYTLDLAARDASMFFVSNDRNPAMPDRLAGRASAGNSNLHTLRRDRMNAVIGAPGHGTTDPGTVTIGGKTWLVNTGSSAMLVCDAGGAARNPSHIMPGSFSITAAVRVDEMVAAPTFPSGPYSILGPIGDFYAPVLAPIASGALWGCMINAANSVWQTVSSPPGTLLIGEAVVVQMQYNAADGTFRVRKGKGTWTTYAGVANRNPGLEITPMAVMSDCFASKSLPCALGGIFVERAFAPDMNEIHDVFAGLVGLA